MSAAFVAFLESRRRDLQRIAARTNAEYSVDDLVSESWLMAVRISHKRGWPFDWSSEDDQDTLLAWLHNEFVKYADKAMRLAVKLDRDWDSDEDSERAGAALARLLTAPKESDPEVGRMVRESNDDLAALVRHSYSEAAAYVLLLIRADWHWDDLARLLRIALATLRRRVMKAALLARVQPTLFDGRSVLECHQLIAAPRGEVERSSKVPPRA